MDENNEPKTKAIERLKTDLGVDDATGLIEDAVILILDYTNQDKMLDSMWLYARQLATINFNRESTEGESSRSEGGVSQSFIEDIPLNTVEQVIKTNLLGYIHGAYTVLPIFKKQKEGILINNVSIGGWMPAPYSTAYSSTKFGIRGMVEGLQGEVSDEPNIHIVGLYPGIQQSTGNSHSAKYSGLDFKIPPFSSDPRDLAAQMVEAAKNPKKSIITDGYAAVMKVMYGLFPKSIINTASAAMRLTMKPNAETDTDGNVRYPSEGPLKIYGEMAFPILSRKTRTVLMMGLGIGLGFLLSASSKKNKK